MEAVDTIRRPVMRYPGGKFRIADWLVSHYPVHDFYVSAFTGASSDFWRKPRSKAEILNDLNGDVINVYKVLENETTAAELERLLDLTPFSYQLYKEAFLPTDDPVQRARWMIFRSFATIGTDGIFREGAGFRGLKNHEDALTTAHEWQNYKKYIPLFKERLQGVILEQRDARDVIQIYDSPTTFTYADPPYLMATRGRKRPLYANEVNGNSIEEEELFHSSLAAVLNDIEGTAIISGYDHPLYDKWYKGWKKETIAARKMGNGATTECIWIHPRIQLQGKLF